MLPDQYAREDEVCPVREELLGELYRASKLGLPVLLSTVAPDIRVLLALFCYRRSHLHTIGLAIAADCDEDELVRSGGPVGAALFAKSRESPQPRPVASHYAQRRKITLATGPLRKMARIDNELDEEASESVPAVRCS
jgi:hypothetical protein